MQMETNKKNKETQKLIRKTEQPEHNKNECVSPKLVKDLDIHQRELELNRYI